MKRGKGKTSSLKGTRLPRVRLLPLVIFVAVSMLSVRLGTLWHDIDVSLRRLDVQRQGTRESVPSHAHLYSLDVRDPSTPRVVASIERQPKDTLIEINSAVAQEASEVQDTPSPSRLGDLEDDGVSFTPTEVDVLQKLAIRREVLDQRERELDTRNGLLQAAEKRIDRKIAELKNLQQAIDQLLNRHNEAEKKRIDQLVKIYATMKPKDAAGIFNALEMDILLTIMENMKEAKTAPILAAMAPEKARAVTMEMSRRHQLPSPGGQGP